MEGSDMDVVRTTVGAIAIAMAIIAVEVMRIDETARRNRRRVMWMKDILRKRNEEGTFNVLIPQLLSDDCQY